MTTVRKTRRPSLRDVRMYWIDGQLKRNGKEVSYEQCFMAIQKKWKEWGNEDALLDSEVYDVVYKDKTYLTKAIPQHLKKEAEKTALKKLTMRMEALKLEKEIVELKEKRDRKNQAQFTKLLNESKPSDYNLEFFQRMKLDFVILAVMSFHPELSEIQIKSIIGNWIVKGL